MARPDIREMLFEVVETQVREGTPSCTGETLERLIGGGVPREEAMRRIAFELLSEMNEMMRERRVFDEARYAAALSRLSARA